MQTVVNNLIFTNNLNIQPEVRTRVLLTTPLESFTIGHTIVLSRGLLDVLPDEPTLAMILAHELGHLALGHCLDTKFAVNDRMFFADEDTFSRFDFSRDPAGERAAGRWNCSPILRIKANWKKRACFCGLCNKRRRTQESHPFPPREPVGQRKCNPQGGAGQLFPGASSQPDRSNRGPAIGSADQARSLQLPVKLVRGSRWL
jgi:hypothetical protein